MYFFLLLFPLSAFAQNSFPPLGHWREHMPYHGSVDVTASEKKIYSATPHSFFSIDLETKEITRFSKVSGLSETGISTIKFDLLSQKLYIAYSNSNIDVMDEKGIHNIPDIKRENIAGDKNIYQIYPDNTVVYLSTGIGVILLDAAKYEIKDSWFIGNSGGFVKVNAFAKNNGFFYAATEEGLKQITTTASNPADFTNWQVLSGSNGLPAAAAKGVAVFDGKTIVIQNNILFVEAGGNWTPFFDNGWPILGISVSGNKMFVMQQQSAGPAQIVVLDPAGNILDILQNGGLITFPKNAISVNNETWIADYFGGLSHWHGGTFDLYKLNSPVDIALGGMTVHNSIFYATAGSVNEAWNYQYNRGGIFRFAHGGWTSFNQYFSSKLDSLMDFITITIDPRDASVWAGSFGGGLLHLKTDNQMDIYKQNSPIAPTVGDPTSYRVSGLAFDLENNLWISNFGATTQLHVLKNDGTWRSFTAPFLINHNAAAQIVIDDANQKWIQAPLGNGLIVFNHNQTIDNPSDDKWRMYRQGAGQGNLPSNYVMCLARDKSGFIWVGTDNGVAVIQCPQSAFINGCEAVWPIIKEDAFANYLFKGQEVRSIAVDGADRKWMATATGAWLVSPDGDKVLAHFTELNSPLLSNDVKSVAIDGATGEVYFGTAKGICSYRGYATEAEETKNQVLVFPNPVPPSYNGSIGIKGLPDNSIVKITETNGRLVYQTRALGGQASWNGRDYQGQQAASGIYLVIATDDLRQEKVVAKIVFISR